MDIRITTDIDGFYNVYDAETNTHDEVGPERDVEDTVDAILAAVEKQLREALLADRC